MYLDQSKIVIKEKTYTRVLLRHSYRQDGRILKKTIANLSNCTEEEIRAIKFALENKNNIKNCSPNNQLIKGKSIGSVFVLNEIANKIGIKKTLGKDRNSFLALWQIIARIIAQGSRLSATRLAAQTAACDILNLESFNENDLYRNLDWIGDKQEEIEKKLFQSKSNINLFLYDVTSSYFEGDQNELAAYGYNRDGKKGKKQIVIGLLTDELGEPISIEVFKGNTSDSTTFPKQIEKVKQKFGVKDIVFVGDRGMIKKTENIADLTYITAITKPQIETLLQENIIQMELFDKDVIEIKDGEIRYILRRNPHRALEMSLSRESKIESIKKIIKEKNEYLLNHPNAKTETGIKLIMEKIKKLKLDSFVELKNNDRKLYLEINRNKLEKISKLDGCYVIKTNLFDLSAKIIHERYKDLTFVEHGFRTIKTAHLETRPYYVRKEKRTKAHVFIVMLAYKLIRYLKEKWKDLEITVEEGISELSSICSIKTSVCEKCQIIPKTRGLTKKLLDKLEIVLPETIVDRQIIVDTNKKLVNER